MHIVYELLASLHLLGMAALVGGWLVSLRADVMNTVMVWGARLQLLTGVLLVGLAEADGRELDHVKIGVKLVIALLVLALAEVAASKERRGEEAPSVRNAAGGLAVLDVLVASLWHLL
ncbi:hypothetical protein CYJ76_09770 [Kytococcus schroeteri]|uniref:Integral membrane protein n=1 Tax=Kytococcus schroeteri TaxID=138300 RepID=A0A2I1P8S1_9MICO|nr:MULTISPECIES: hypothetical protein [Kytococcus]OFS10212.1 hypothetical protein HMPREF3099_08835 [Kytococcus sp. HMSC28H12]PKZ41029.1 hypothetical protein CYJ76_09770 [Kytococcus schroeteri]